jgi:hypothetical protein
MAAGAGAAVGMVKALAILVGMVGIWRSNRAKRRGETTPEDDEHTRWKAERAATERRMQAYLAGRKVDPQPADDRTDEEIRR